MSGTAVHLRVGGLILGWSPYRSRAAWGLSIPLPEWRWFVNIMIACGSEKGIASLPPQSCRGWEER